MKSTLALGMILLVLATPAVAAPVEFVADFEVTGTRAINVPIGSITPPRGSLIVDDATPGIFQPNGQADVATFLFEFDDLDVVAGLLRWTHADDIISPPVGNSRILFDAAGSPTWVQNLTVRDLTAPDPGGLVYISVFLDGTWDMQPLIGQEQVSGTYTLSVARTAIPEPSALVLCGLGLLGLAWRRARRVR